MLFIENTKYPLGLDISPDVIRLVQLKKSGDKIKFQALTKNELPDNTFENGEIKDKEALYKSIKHALNNPLFGKFTVDEVVASLPESKTFIKLIEVDRSPNDLAGLIESALEKHIPFSIKEIYYDWQIIKTLPEKYLILIGVAPKQLVDDFISVIEATGLSLAALEIDCTAVCRCFLAEEANKKIKSQNNYALIDLNKFNTAIIFYGQNTILFTISLPISGLEIINKIASALEIDANQAEKAKNLCGFDDKSAEGVIKNILSPIIEELIAKVNESIEFYNNHFQAGGPINKIIICGDAAEIKDLDKIIFQAIKIPVEIGKINTNIDFIDDKINNLLKNDNSADLGLSFGRAIGLSLRGVLVKDF